MPDAHSHCFVDPFRSGEYEWSGYDHDLSLGMCARVFVFVLCAVGGGDCQIALARLTLRDGENPGDALKGRKCVLSG